MTACIKISFLNFSVTYRFNEKVRECFYWKKNKVICYCHVMILWNHFDSHDDKDENLVIKMREGEGMDCL